MAVQLLAWGWFVIFYELTQTIHLKWIMGFFRVVRLSLNNCCFPAESFLISTSFESSWYFLSCTAAFEKQPFLKKIYALVSSKFWVIFMHATLSIIFPKKPLTKNSLKNDFLFIIDLSIIPRCGTTLDIHSYGEY